MALHAHMRAAPVLRLGTERPSLPLPFATYLRTQHSRCIFRIYAVVLNSLGRCSAMRYSMHHATMAYDGLSSSG